MRSWPRMCKYINNYARRVNETVRRFRIVCPGGVRVDSVRACSVQQSPALMSLANDTSWRLTNARSGSTEIRTFNSTIYDEQSSYYLRIVSPSISFYAGQRFSPEVRPCVARNGNFIRNTRVRLEERRRVPRKTFSTLI